MQIQEIVDNDILVVNGVISLVSGKAQIAQHVRHRLLHFAGEWFLDTSAGIPYFEEILVRNLDVINAENIFKRVILTTPNIDRLLTFSLDFQQKERLLQVSFTAKSLREGLIEDNINLSEVL